MNERRQKKPDKQILINLF